MCSTPTMLLHTSLRANQPRGTAQMKLADLPRRQGLPTAASLMGRLNSVVRSMDQGISASGDCWDNVDLEADLPEDVRANSAPFLVADAPQNPSPRAYSGLGIRLTR